MVDINRSAYDILLGTQFQVALERDGEEVVILCRPLPFSTLMAVLGEVALSAQAQLVHARKQIIENFVSQGFTNMEYDQVVDVLMPIFSAIAVEAPDIIERILMDVCIDMEPEYVKLFTVEDVLDILIAVVSKVDIKRVADKAKKVFSQATEIGKVAMESQIATETVHKKNSQRKKNSKSPSQSKQPI